VTGKGDEGEMFGTKVKVPSLPRSTSGNESKRIFYKLTKETAFFPIKGFPSTHFPESYLGGEGGQRVAQDLHKVYLLRFL